MHRRIGPDGLELGYWIDKGHLREGLATAVARALTHAALSIPDVDRVEIRHDKENTASAGVPRKLGYEFIGEQPATAQSGLEWVWRHRLADA